MGSSNRLETYVKLANWHSYQRIASFAGPLAMKYVVQIAGHCLFILKFNARRLAHRVI